MKYKYRETFIGEDGIRHDVKANTSAELKEKIKRIEADIEAGYSPIRRNNTTVKKWAFLCFDQYKTNISEETKAHYLHKLKRYILPIIGHFKVKDVKPLQCQEVLNSMSGYASDTMRKVKQIMFFIFDKAVENRLTRENPAERLTIPKGHKSTRRAITERERSIILRTVDERLKDDYRTPDGKYQNVNENERFKYVYFLFMLFCGCRPSEVAEIQKRDITIMDGVNMLHIRGTKTDNADRMVPIPDYLMSRIPKVKEPFEYIFTNLRGGKLSESNRQRLWRAFKRDLNITAGAKVYRNKLIPQILPIAEDLVPYCLRHTYCTDLQKSGVDIRQAQYLMGHSDIKITANIYTHQDDETLLEVANKMRMIK